MQVLLLTLVWLTGQSLGQETEQYQAKGKQTERYQAVGKETERYDDAHTLRGLGSFDVIVNVYGQPMPDFPVMVSQLQRDVEKRLTTLGIPVPQTFGFAVPQKYSTTPALCVEVDILTINVPGTVRRRRKMNMYHSFSINVSFIDQAMLSTGERHLVPVWSKGFIGYTPLWESTQTIPDAVIDQIDKFADAWLKTHPKEPTTEKKPLRQGLPYRPSP